MEILGGIISGPSYSAILELIVADELGHLACPRNLGHDQLNDRDPETSWA